MQSQHYNNGNNGIYDNVMHVSEVSVWFGLFDGIFK